jgi:prepilin-type N-terminal cleavage/methylation domain-containing protein
LNSDVELRSRHGVTIVELLIVIAVLGVLLALSLPALRGMRSSARNVAAEATIRQHATLIGTYVADFKDAYPWLGLPNQNGMLTLLRQTGEPFTINYFETCSAWPSAMTSYYGDSWPHPSQAYPVRRNGLALYLYSCAMITDPAFWNERTRQGVSQWRATRATEVSDPSRKALLTSAVEVEPYPRWVKEGLTMAMCDGTVGFYPRRMLADPVPSGDGTYPGFFHIRGYYGLDTPDGVRGRDIK